MSEPVAKNRPMIDIEEFERRLRGPLTPERSGEDPLAELARLVAGGDPYQDVFADPNAQRLDHEHDQRQDYGHERGYAPEPAAVEPHWDFAEPAPVAPSRPTIDFAAIEAGLLRGSVQPEFVGDPEPSLGAAAYQSAPYPEAGAAAFHAARYPEPPVEWREAAPEPPRSRKPLYMMAAVIVLGIAGIGASFAYKGRVAGAQQIATIMAAPGPTKVQPPQQSDADAPAQNASVLDKSASPATVALADHREEPVDVTQIKVQSTDPTGGLLPPAAPAGSDPHIVATRPPQPQPPAAPDAANPGQDQQPVGIAALIEPKKVKTVSVRPDGTLLPNDTPPQAASPAAPAAAPPPRPAVAAKPATPKTAHAATTPREAAVERVDRNAPLSLTPPPVKSRPVAAAKPLHVADATPTATEPVRSGGGAGEFAVQLAAPGSEKEARETTSRLEHQYAGQLDGHQPSIRKAKVGEKEVYRVRVGGLSREDAVTMCEKIKSGGGKCFIAHD